MKKREKTTVYEDEEAKKQRYAEEHIVECPHCGEGVFDHMKTCPHCGGKLDPKGYQPLTDKQIKKVKTITWIVGMVIAVAVVILYFALWKK